MLPCHPDRSEAERRDLRALSVAQEPRPLAEPDGTAWGARMTPSRTLGGPRMIVTTTHDIQGKMINDYLGIVVG